jgi:hypothetical protein
MRTFPIESNGGKVMVIGDIGIMKGGAAYNYYCTIKFTGLPPQKDENK